MLETLKAQYQNGRALTQNKYFYLNNRSRVPRFMFDLYPIAQDYYHELNPYFLAALYRPELYQFAPLITVRDGYVYFASYLVNNFTHIAKSGLRHLIHPDLAPIVPTNLKDQFACWQISHPKKIDIKEAKKVVIFGLMAEQYLGSIEDLPKRLEVLKDLPKSTQVEAYLPIRREPLKDPEIDRESVLVHRTIDLLNEALPHHRINFLTGDKFMERSDFHGTYLLDLAPDRFLISDNYLHYFVCSRGGSVNLVPKDPPADSIFELDLSIHHRLHVTPLPETPSYFVDLLFHKKQFPTRELERDPLFQTILRDKLQRK